MRVLIIDVNCKHGSTGKIAYGLYSYLLSRDDEAAVCYGRGPKIKEKNIYKFGLDWETYLHAFLTRITGYTGCFSYFSTKRLIRFIKKFKPDVVHIHELHAYFVNIVMLLNYLKKQEIKVVHTLHCAFSFTGKCGHHFDCDKWKNSCGHCPKLKEYVSTLCFDHTKSMFLKKKKAFTGFKNMSIVCPSEWLANYAKQSFLGQYPIKVIHNGVDTSIFYPRDSTGLRKRLDIKKDEKVILAVAPDLMSEAKGGKWIIKLATELQNLANIRFLMIGVNDTSSDFPSNILVFNKTSNQDELANYYSLADLFVICSSMENFPTTCLEAQCCGTPICGFDVGGTKETSIGEPGLFVPYGDIEALANIIQKSKLINTEQRNHIAQVSFDLYSSVSMNKQYLELFNDCRTR